MASEPTYTIGQTSQICGIPVQTLRFYDRIGLVKPAGVDASSGYRYYSHRDIMQIKIVQDLKEMDFSLEEIGRLLLTGDAEALLGILKEKREDTLREAERLQRLSATIEKRIGLLEEGKGLRQTAVHGRYWLELKRLPDRIAACIRKRSACGMEPYIIRFTELFQEMRRQELKADGYMFAVYHEPMLTFDRTDADIEVGIPIQAAPDGSGLVRILPGGEFLTSYSRGPSEEKTCREIYLQMMEWTERNGYSPTGPVMEEYRVDMAQMGKPEEFLVELRLPVKKC